MVTINEKNSSSKDEAKVEEEIVSLHQIYRSMLAGDPLSRGSQDCASLLSSQTALQGHQPAEIKACGSGQSGVTIDDRISRAEDKADHAVLETQLKVCPQEAALLRLSLIKTIITKVLCPETKDSNRHKYAEIISILLKQKQIDSQMISLLGCSDKLLAHMASKCMAYLVLFQLKEESKVNEAWLQVCLEMFSDPATAPPAEYLGSLLEVLKGVFRDRRLNAAESLPKLLGPLDATLEGLYDFLLSLPSSHSCRNNDLSCFIDLLEVLVAFRVRLRLCFMCQRIPFLKASQALALVTSPIPYFIKKKLVLLLKKCLLSKAGEDLLPAPLPAWALQDPCSGTDMLALAQAILRAVDSGWLQQISVGKKSSHFGGPATVSENDAHPGPDIGILRALSLTSLKALEIKLQPSASGVGVKGDVQGFMSQLLTFLQTHLQRPWLGHACEWISIFIEQDDDMLEAMKTLLTLYLACERLCSESAAVQHHGEEDAPWSRLTHDGGYNPHCLFLFFLHNIVFDATVLLDFLISSETCFLEYFVRYLKLLTRDWSHFCHVCTLFCPRAVKDASFVCESGTSEPDPSVSSAFCETEEGVPLSLPPTQKLCVTVKRPGGKQSVKPSLADASSLGAPQSLVDYGSSEESELGSLANANQSCARQLGSSEMRGINRAELETAFLKPKADSTSSLQKEPCDDGAPTEGPLLRSVRCLQELRKAVSRLHGRNLFPYNPTALLKLLVHIESLAGRRMD
ncbi:protein Lines homolog 1-like [Rhinatrema bivittatum]|uniref:protein Lines homolog 1-like n=1 Tax=Rhinatrema bivittatum TaxID=194408 RepID=UPI00112DC545|nr:protein Lines homolog 1-like [Rhinatrema bivittatum]XP_029431494.1 protein Lines homolog 1-like [Rhinatrema bivittatum]